MPDIVTVLTDDVEPIRSISIAAATAEPLTSIGRRDVTESLPRIATVDAETSGGSEPAGVAASSAGGAKAFRPGSLQVERLIGRGGMGAVYQAVQPSLGRHVAVKRLLRDSGGLDDWRTIQFHQEAVISARLAHPNIVPVHDFGVDDEGTPLLSMKLVQGSSWSEALDRDRKAGTYEELLSTHIPILMQVAQAVAFAHSRGIVHRDLKPSQVMLGEFGEVLLMDWGLALSIADGGAADAKTTLRAPTPVPLPDRSTGSSPCGTPAYMAPEQTRPTAAGVGTWTDVYLLGATLYYILTATHPHQGPTAVAVLRKAAAGEVEPPSKRAPDRAIPPDLEALCLKAMQPTPDDRVPSAIAFFEGLRDHVSGAGRRREALAIVEELEAALNRGLADYEACSACLSRARRIESLAPGLETLTDLTARIHTRWAELALGLGDLQLAGLQASQLPSGSKRSGLEARIAQESNRRRASERQRRLAIAGAFVLLLALLGSGVVFAERIRQERDTANRERQTATTRANASASLAKFMLGDLGENLDPQIERDRVLIEKIAAQVMNHYRTLDVSQDSAETRRAHAAAIRSSAEALSDLGRAADGLELMTMAIDVLRSAAPDAHAELMDFHAMRSETLYLFGKMQEALEAADLALEEWKLAGEPMSMVYTTALNNRAAALLSLGRVKDALEIQQQVVDRRLQLVGPEHEETVIAQMNLAVQTAASGNMPGAWEIIAPVIETAKRALPDAKVTLEVIRFGIVVRANTGQIRDVLEEQKVLEAAHLKVFGPAHPRTLMARHDGGMVLVHLREHEAAAAKFTGIIEVARTLPAANSLHLTLALRQRARMLQNLGRHEEALADAREAVEIGARTGGRNTTEFIQLLTTLALMRGDDSDARRRERIAEHDEAIALMEKLEQTRTQDYTISLMDRGRLGESVGEPDLGLAFFLKAEAIHIADQGPKSPASIGVSIQVIDRLLTLGRTAEALTRFAELEARMEGVQLPPARVENFEALAAKIRAINNPANGTSNPPTGS